MGLNEIAIVNAGSSHGMKMRGKGYCRGDRENRGYDGVSRGDRENRERGRDGFSRVEL